MESVAPRLCGVPITSPPRLPPPSSTDAHPAVSLMLKPRASGGLTLGSRTGIPPDAHTPLGRQRPSTGSALPTLAIAIERSRKQLLPVSHSVKPAAPGWQSVAWPTPLIPAKTPPAPDSVTPGRAPFLQSRAYFRVIRSTACAGKAQSHCISSRTWPRAQRATSRRGRVSRTAR